MEDFSDRLQHLLTQTGQARWWPPIQVWLHRFDGWYVDCRDEEREPAWAITYHAIKRAPLPANPAEAAFFLAQLPFNAWCAATLSISERWNPLLASYREFIARSTEPVCPAVAAAPPPQRVTQTTQWLLALYHGGLAPSPAQRAAVRAACRVRPKPSSP